MGSETVTAENAYKYADTYSIWRADMVMHYGCEHNQEEAEAVAKWITYNRGDKAVVVKNRPDQVTAAKAIRGGDVPRYRLREQALQEMGVWSTPKRKRGGR